MSAKDKRPPAVAAARIRWKFEDGRDMTVPMVDFETQLQAQYHAMAASDDPVLRIEGRKLLDKAAEQAVAKQLADARISGIAKGPRPGARRPIKERIQTMMRSHKREGTQFKIFLQSWKNEALGGLRLTVTGENYIVEDEDEDAGTATYTFGALQNLYSQSLRPKP